MRPPRLSAEQLAEHLMLQPPEVRRLARVLRRVVLRAAPRAAERVKFRCLCYYRPEASFGAIGGNICMIEARRSGVALSFIQGAEIDDPDRLLRGTGKAKRHMPVGNRAEALDQRVASLVGRAAELAAQQAISGK